MNDSVKWFFQRYEELFNRALHGEANIDDVVALYAAEFVASTPAGVIAGKNDAGLQRIMAQGYERYRAIGTKRMRIRHIRTSPIDDGHCVAHVAWTATYARAGGADVMVDFEVHYLVRTLDGEPKVFGWVSGDEKALLEEHGIV